jgi:hypothetical protein
MGIHRKEPKRQASKSDAERVSKQQASTQTHDGWPRLATGLRFGPTDDNGHGGGKNDDKEQQRRAEESRDEGACRFSDSGEEIHPPLSHVRRPVGNE